MSELDSKILYICIGHQDADYKVEYLLELLKKVKSQGCNICYGTHCSYRLNDISEYCDVIYDKNNEYLTEEFFFENIQEVREETFTECFRYTYTPNHKIELMKLFNTSQGKPCFLNIKNVLSFAKSNDYEWIVFFEYDSLLPEYNLHEKVKKRIRVLNNLNKDGYGYMAEDMRSGVLFPHLFISKVDVFYNDKNFNLPSRSNIDYLRTYGNNVPEEILWRIFNSNEKFILTSAYNLESDYDYDKDLTDSISGKAPFSIFALSECQHEKSETKKFKRDCSFGFYPSKNSEGLFNLDFYLTKKSDTVYNFDFIKVYVDDEIVMNFETTSFSLSWYFDTVIKNYQIEDIDKIIRIEYQLKLPDGETLSEEIKMNMRHIEKYFLYKNAKYID